jgi:hypothetical protein
MRRGANERAQLRTKDVGTLEAKAQQSEVMRVELGEPITMGWVVSGSIKINNGDGTADVNVPVSGPKGSASIHTVGTKKGGGPWSFTTMQAVIEGSGKQADLLKP